jgi:diguanylate cyclase (GGDEF)-like protein
MDRLQQSINLTLRKNLSFALLFLDLDRFKSINDTMGHTAGDEILKEASRRLLTALRDSDVAARFGGDEFALLLPETNKEASVLVAKKIINALRDTFVLGEQLVNLGVSIGIAVYPDDGKNCEALIKRADSAMYYAKKKSLGFSFVPAGAR